METKFEVGDKVVWCGAIGTVIDINPSQIYPIKVRFIENKETGDYVFMRDGRYLDFQNSPSIHIYEKAKKKKKYWLWSFRLQYGQWYKNNNYFDDNGTDTLGGCDWMNWETMDKIKHEKEFIEV